MEITVTRAETLKPKPDQTKLGFGTIFTDYIGYRPDQYQGIFLCWKVPWGLQLYLPT